VAGQCPTPSSGLTPLTDLGSSLYQGRSGGLYPGGTNVPPPEYLEVGQRAASKVKPINGKIVVLSQGYSNVHQEFTAFASLASTDVVRNPAILLVNGAQPGKDALEWQDPANDAWATADAALAAAGVGRADVQVIWFKTTRIGEKWEFPTDAERLRKWTRTWGANMEATYPNLKLIYASSRIYGG
jgi:hypothetical protein